MNINPLISIIIPAYNVAAYLEQCVGSVLEQTFSNYEIILVDDGATDNTGSICDAYSGNKKIKIIHKENGGLSDARNVGLESACGQYIAFLDADDYWCDRDFLKKISKKVNLTDVDILVFGYNKVLKDSIIEIRIPDSNATNILDLVREDSFNICAWDKIVRRELLVNNKIDFRKKVYSEDMEWCSKLFSVANTCSVLQQAPYMYRQREGSITKTLSDKNIKDIYQNYGRCLYVQKSMDEERKRAFNYFLSKNFSMFLIAITQIEKSKQEQYYSFIKQNKDILKYNSRKREKLMYYCLSCFGIRITENLIGCLYKRRG